MTQQTLSGQKARVTHLWDPKQSLLYLVLISKHQLVAHCTTYKTLCWPVSSADMSKSHI